MCTAGFVIALSTREELIRSGLCLGPNHTVNDMENIGLQNAKECLVTLFHNQILRDWPIRVFQN